MLKELSHNNSMTTKLTCITRLNPATGRYLNGLCAGTTYDGEEGSRWYESKGIVSCWVITNDVGRKEYYPKDMFEVQKVVKPLSKEDQPSSENLDELRKRHTQMGETIKKMEEDLKKKKKVPSKNMIVRAFEKLDGDKKDDLEDILDNTGDDLGIQLDMDWLFTVASNKDALCLNSYYNYKIIKRNGYLMLVITEEQ